MNSQPPKELFQDSSRNVVLEVRIHQDEHGRVWSLHQFRSSRDERQATQWSGGGARQIAFAFLTEAVRREAFASILAELTKNRNSVNDYKNFSDEKKAEIEKGLGYVIQTVLAETVSKMSVPIAKEILQMVSRQD